MSPEPGAWIPTDGEIFLEQIGINDWFGAEYAHNKPTILQQGYLRKLNFEFCYKKLVS